MIINTWIHSQFPIDLWNHFRDERPHTNNFCEGYNSRLIKKSRKVQFEHFRAHIGVTERANSHRNTAYAERGGNSTANKQKRDV